MNNKFIFIILILLTAGLITFIIIHLNNNNQDHENEETVIEEPDEKIEEEKEIEFLTKPEDFIDLFSNNKFEDLYEQTSDDFKALVNFQQFSSMAEAFNENVQSYELVSSFDFEDLSEFLWISNQYDKGILAHFNDELVIEAILITPVLANQDTDYNYTENIYRMPINEEFFVGWGGTNELVNYHYALDIQRYAYDLLIRIDGYSYDGDPTENESYYAFGKEVVAPLSGTIIEIENNMPDHKPGIETDAENPLGNYVVIEHDHDEYSIIAHLKEGSVTVSLGDMVEAGEVIGLVGNSGNTSEPHIHFQVSNGPDFFEAQSLRIRFENEIEPIRGHFVEGF